MDFLDGTSSKEWSGAQNVILSGIGHDMRKILAHLRPFLHLLIGESRKAIQSLIALLKPEATLQEALSAA